MGKLLVIFRINPLEQEQAEETLAAVKALKSIGELKDIKMDSPGFGIKIVKAAFVLPNEKEDEIETLTQQLNALELVENAENDGMTLL
ncbi:MAG: hypothetical protein HY917_03025 [Candidatus Diapherotrites archaeon]|nr:hypothetical protein [Candidatus Diapherotrites archaeon]